MKIYQLKTDKDKAHFRELSIEYFTYMFENLTAKYGIPIDIDSAEYADQSMASLEKFAPPTGHLLLCEIDGEIAGMGGMIPMGDNYWEIKRIYVRPQFRGKGIARQLLEQLIMLAREGDYSAIRLETIQFMTAAQRLYRTFGFEEIGVYEEGEMPTSLAENMVYFELKLGC